MECFGYGFNKFLNVSFGQDPDEFLSLLFQILEHPIPKVLKLILQILNCLIFNFPKHIFNQVPPIYTYREVGDFVCIITIQPT
jgi:hypothetical protein